MNSLKHVSVEWLKLRFFCHLNKVYCEKNDLYQFTLKAQTSQYSVAICSNVMAVERGVVGNAMVLGKLPVLGLPTVWMIVGQVLCLQ